MVNYYFTTFCITLTPLYNVIENGPYCVFLYALRTCLIDMLKKKPLCFLGCLRRIMLNS